MYTALGCGRKPKYPEKTHANLGKMCRLHTDNGCGWESNFFFLISVTIMLFENVLLLGDMSILLNECNCIKIVLSGTNKENEVIKTIDYIVELHTG